MCHVRAQIEDGLIASERVARVQTIDGIEEVFVSDRQVQNGHLIASSIHRTTDKVLVELPRESTSGRWRVWVPAALVENA